MEHSTLSELLGRLMRDREVSIRGLASGLGVTYEYARRLVKGEALPSRQSAEGIATFFGLDGVELSRMIDSEKIRRRYPHAGEQVIKSNLPVDWPLIWGRLTEDQQRDLLLLATRWAERADAS